MKTFFHVDMDAFFVSVEEIFDPALKGKPVWSAAAWTSAASFQRHPTRPASSVSIRRCRSARPIGYVLKRSSSMGTRTVTGTAPVKCSVCSKASPLVEMASIDEAYLDITGTEKLHGRPLLAAHQLHESIRRETRLKLFHRDRQRRAHGR